ncbi:MAG: glutaredoxin family protein [Candidatus Portnoybacteria bacterium]|nr:glutaredoxin family protein [Candidatus Portnoybacteria bacterium]
MTKSVAIYTTPTCVWCKATKEFFAENKVSYTEYNVAGDQAKVQEMVQKSGQMGVPVIVISDENGKEEVVVGFNKPRLKELLEIKS